jgi:DNA (cytosine-5)-methyltransferase 1
MSNPVTAAAVGLLPARVPLNYASLFSGIGGFDIGFDRAGMRCVAQAEMDQHASEVLKHHWPNVTHLKDVRDVTRDSFRSIDVLCGGFPCQDVSVAGKRAGLDGERSGLWFEFYRIIKEHTPRWVVIENVPGLLTSNRGRDFAVIIDGLVKCGYGVCWRVLDAQYFGLAQRRKRVFIVASFGDGRCAEVLFEREGSTGNSKPSRTEREGATAFAIKGAAIGRQPHNGPQYGEISADGTSYTLNTSEVHAVAGTLPASGAGTARTGNERNEASFLVATAIDVRNSRSNGDISGTLQAKKSGGYSLNYTNPIAFQSNASHLDSMPVTENFTPTLRTEPLSVGVFHADADETDTREILRTLLQKIGAEAFEQWAVRIADTFQSPEILRQGLYGEGLRFKRDESIASILNLTPSFEKISSARELRTLWLAECVGCTSQRWGLDKQQSKQLRTALSKLSQLNPSAGEIVCHLREASEGVGVLRETLSTLQEIRRPTDDQSKPAHTSYGVRRLTPRECERLQGFPDNWTAVNGQADSRRYKQLGNAVAVPVAEWIARRIVKADMPA